MPDAYDQVIKETIAKIEASKSLDPDPALALANEVAKAVNAAMREAQEQQDFTRMEELARQAEAAYLLASRKVPSGDRDVIAFASTYWSLKADHARLDAQLAQKAPYRPTTVAPPAGRPRELSEVLKRGQPTPRPGAPPAEEAAPRGQGLRDTVFKGARMVGAAAASLAVAAALEALREAREPGTSEEREKAKPAVGAGDPAGRTTQLETATGPPGPRPSRARSTRRSEERQVPAGPAPGTAGSGPTPAKGGAEHA